MGIRIVQVCGLWFWAAFTFFFFVLLHQYRIISLPAIQTPSESINHEAIRAGLNTSERFARSEASWRASVDLRHKIAAQGMDPQNPLFSSNFMQHPYTIWNFYPPSWTCPHDVQRVGRLGDGGKWVCGMSLYETVPAPKLAGDKETIIYSFRINGESTFEEDMLARIPSSRIWAYDFSVESFGP
ncbi:hypothetical protein B0O99DRAFT_680892 [Bisporella sp. PMI_857]|nr:hypothetical protein B0O99DRAFT_680892 [Bisporella sp. PMI_857]